MATRNRALNLLASDERTATTQTGDMANREHRGVRVHIDVTDAEDTPSVVFKVQGKDHFTGDYYDLLASAAVTATGDTYLLVYPGVAAAANAAVSQALPPYWRVLATHADADPITYQVTAELLG